jgi:hypothetical protein
MGKGTMASALAASSRRRLERCLKRIAQSFALPRQSVYPPCKRMKRGALPLLVVVLLPALAQARVLSQNDLDRLSEMNTVFSKLTSNLAQSFKRPDISRDESDCIRSTWQELNQTSEELSSYQYLIGVVSGIDDPGEEDAMRGLIRFALDKTIQVLEAERKRLSQVPDQCLRFSVSVGMSQQALQFIDGATSALKSIQPRL